MKKTGQEEDDKGKVLLSFETWIASRATKLTGGTRVRLNAAYNRVVTPWQHL